MGAGETGPMIAFGIVSVIFATLGIVGIVAIVGAYWTTYRSRMRTREMGFRLVNEMVGRGMAAEEIVPILAAWHQDRRAGRRLMDERKGGSFVEMTKKPRV
jgi:hypothetical protein